MGESFKKEANEEELSYYLENAVSDCVIS